ncbi:alanine dehydrogenase, partial [Cellulomonas sp. A375-1]
MIVAVPQETKNREYRVALTPAGAHQLVTDGHRVLVQTGAGSGSAIGDDEYRAAGAE